MLGNPQSLWESCRKYSGRYCWRHRSHAGRYGS